MHFDGGHKVFVQLSLIEWLTVCGDCLQRVPIDHFQFHSSFDQTNKVIVLQDPLIQLEK